jgi:hypothetical protein
MTMGLLELADLSRIGFAALASSATAAGQLDGDAAAFQRFIALERCYPFAASTAVEQCAAAEGSGWPKRSRPCSASWTTAKPAAGEDALGWSNF